MEIIYTREDDSITREQIVFLTYDPESQKCRYVTHDNSTSSEMLPVQGRGGAIERALATDGNVIDLREFTPAEETT